jgi:hypothetical protein
MSALEQEIVEKFHLLSPAAKQRVRALIEQEVPADSADSEVVDRSDFDYDAWFQRIEVLRNEIRASQDGSMPSIDVVGMLRDIRDGEDE